MTMHFLPRLLHHKINWIDLLIGLAFLIYAACFFLVRLQNNYPNVVLDGDASNIASLAANQGHPELFLGDEVLGNSVNTRLYSTIHLPLLRAMNRLTGNFGLAYAWLLGPHVFLQLLGFYIFGCVLFRNRFWALLLAVSTAVQVLLNMGEFWGLWRDALPRFTFQALLPYILSLALIWKNRPSRWPWLMFLTGLLVYVHPVSTPAWGVAIWLGLWVFIPREWSLRQKIVRMTCVGLMFVVAVSPFVVNYLSNHPQGSSVDYEKLISAIDAYFPSNTPQAIADFLRLLWQNGLLVGGVMGAIITYWLRKDRRRDLALVLAWISGLLLISGIIPFLEFLVERANHLLPFETELVRGLRYLVPFLILLGLWSLVELWRRFPTQLQRAAIGLGGLLLVGLWVFRSPLELQLWDRLSACLAQGKLVCSDERGVDRFIHSVVTRTPKGACMFAYSQDAGSIAIMSTIRYLGLRPLVFSSLDKGQLGFSNHVAFMHWLETIDRVKQIRKVTDRSDRIKQAIDLGKQLNAQYVAFDFYADQSVLNQLQVDALYLSRDFSLVNIHNTTSCVK